MGTILLQYLHTTETYAQIKLFRKVLTTQIKFNITLPFRCLVLMVPVFTKLFRIRIKIRLKLNILILWAFSETYLKYLTSDFWCLINDVLQTRFL